MSTTKWNKRLGQPAWPPMMRGDQFPLLAALDFPELGEVELRNVAGEVEDVKVDICQTPYKSFVLLWVPQRRRRRARQVRIA
jgi:hypothetical protein